MKRILRIGFQTLLYTLYAVIFLLGLTVAVLLLRGMKLYCVETGSMEPAYPIGSMVVVEPVRFDQLKEGDVITYVVSDNTVVTHRLIGIDTEQQLLTTKGDNSNVADISQVSYKNVIGRVGFCVPGFGYAFLLLSTRFGKIMLGIFAVALVGFHILRRLYYKSLDEEQNEAAKALSEETDKETPQDNKETDQKEELKEERSGTL